MASAVQEAEVGLEAGLIIHADGAVSGGVITREVRRHPHVRAAHSMSSSSLRKKSDNSLNSKVQCGILRGLLANLLEVLLGTKLFVLFPAVPLAIVAQLCGFGRAWVFALSLIGLIPLAERLNFLTEQIAFYTGPTVGGLLNATCGNATELIIVIFALHKGKIEVVKLSLVGSILSNLLLVLGTSLLCGGLANIGKEQFFDSKQADVNTGLLMLGALCHVLPLMLGYDVKSGEYDVSPSPTLTLSRASSVVMLIAYFAYLFFQLKTHRQLFESQEEGDDNVAEVHPVIGFPSALAWLIGITVFISVLSEYAVDTIEAASESWGLSTSFMTIILLPMVGNAAEHAGAIIFAFKNKLDITLGVSLGSATQISLFVIPSSVIMGWMMGMQMDLDLRLRETVSLVVSILMVLFALQDGTSHYLKGFVLILSYLVIGACFFVL